MIIPGRRTRLLTRNGLKGYDRLMGIFLAVPALLLRLAVFVAPIGLGIYVVICLRRINTNLQQINEALRRRG